MLAQDDDDKNERVVYYLSKRFHDYETRYTSIEKSIMLFSRMGGTKIETHDPTLPNMSSNGSIEILVWEARLEWKTIEMVDPTGGIQFEVCGEENHQRKHRVKFLCQEPRGRR